MDYMLILYLSQNSDGEIEFLPVDSTDVDSGEVVNILRFQLST